jgi:hypothetical protein
MAKVFLVDASFMLQNQYDLARMAAANILKIEAIKAAKDGQSETYVEMLRDVASGYLSEIRGMQGRDSIPTANARGISHNYDRDGYASKAFSPRHKDETFVEIIGNDIIGRTIRFVD